ncbi:MAG TPA: nickel pincer cofactor biosynthesis protein LarB [Acidobacteriaceae bacterium]|nr:nickel pincer cofactor biosynthesis protein LarB [Acidobacteriaceae bacterium]
MQRDAVVTLLRELQSGSRTVEEVAERLAVLPFEDIGFARIDHHRSLRSGMPEVVFAAGKTPQQTAAILSRLHASGVPALATRADAATFAATQELIPDAQYHPIPRCITCSPAPAESRRPRGHVAVLCAGTSDLPVAEEAALTAEIFGARVSRVSDVGVAGLHRVLAELDLLRTADAVVVCAGMDGALPSVVGGLVAVPVIAVPTSVGYGAAFGGVSALLTMLNSCSPNITVVNIDNGFGAGYTASLYCTRLSE